METQQMSKQMLSFQKQVLDGWYEAAQLAANQAEASITWMVDTASWVPEQGRKAVDQWFAVLNSERSRLKTHVDQGIEMVAKAFTEAKPAAPAKPKNTQTKKRKGMANESD